MSVLSVDGINVVSGEARHLAIDCMLDAGRSADIAGWRKNMAEVAAFWAPASPTATPAAPAAPANTRVIGIAVFREEQPLPVAALPSVAGRASQGARTCRRTGTGDRQPQRPPKPWPRPRRANGPMRRTDPGPPVRWPRAKTGHGSRRAGQRADRIPPPSSSTTQTEIITPLLRQPGQPDRPRHRPVPASPPPTLPGRLRAGPAELVASHADSGMFGTPIPLPSGANRKRRRGAIYNVLRKPPRGGRFRRMAVWRNLHDFAFPRDGGVGFVNPPRRGPSADGRRHAAAARPAPRVIAAATSWQKRR